ncbi:cobalt-precorrin-5B (C(1))-methyltransferase CbiD [Calothrix rhizosoleniae]|uniref:cobalt-precorrin-5B (C(1))-methyltransferase CbiD n=1 Tax=Calothrix rhizosoleniae TaxID=888997 RepID=UPI000B49B6AF|nr:cobalt-precorrin-5B (C(1))-methyltransferase CbiD [Calothrix rhizosoleniae]
MPRSGYTLPVFATAASMAALHWLRYSQPITVAPVDLITPAKLVEIHIEQVAGLGENMALAITRSDPGDNLDLTRDTPIWALVEWRGRVEGVGEWESKGAESAEEDNIIILGGEGVGQQVERENQAAIYSYAQRLLRSNLQPMLAPSEKITVTIILPSGRSLATRTSNSAFGVVDGLSLLGTTGISQPLSAPGQLDSLREQLQAKATNFDCLVFCLGENGLDLARTMGIDPEQLIKTANWIGPMLIEAAVRGVKEILLFGYHGKLMKLAGGIFHTHHHLADGRREVLTAQCAIAGLNTPHIQAIFACQTAEAALQYLRKLDENTGRNWVKRVYSAIVQQIDLRVEEYMKSHIDPGVRIPVCGSIIFGRDRQIIVKSQTACSLIAKLC